MTTAVCGPGTASESSDVDLPGRTGELPGMPLRDDDLWALAPLMYTTKLGTVAASAGPVAIRPLLFDLNLVFWAAGVLGEF